MLRTDLSSFFIAPVSHRGLRAEKKKMKKKEKKRKLKSVRDISFKISSGDRQFQISK